MSKSFIVKKIRLYGWTSLFSTTNTGFVKAIAEKVFLAKLEIFDFPVECQNCFVIFMKVSDTFESTRNCTL